MAPRRGSAGKALDVSVGQEVLVQRFRRLPQRRARCRSQGTCIEIKTRRRRHAEPQYCPGRTRDEIKAAEGTSNELIYATRSTRHPAPCCATAVSAAEAKHSANDH